MEHPAKLSAVEPGRIADYISNTMEIWFPEMICTLARSDGRMEPALLGVCPASGLLMYMPQNYPIQWIVITDAYVEEAYLRYVVEKDMLNEASG